MRLWLMGAPPSGSSEIGPSGTFSSKLKLFWPPFENMSPRLTLVWVPQNGAACESEASTRLRTTVESVWRSNRDLLMQPVPRVNIVKGDVTSPERVWRRYARSVDFLDELRSRSPCAASRRGPPCSFPRRMEPDRAHARSLPWPIGARRSPGPDFEAPPTD